MSQIDYLCVINVESSRKTLMNEQEFKHIAQELQGDLLLIARKIIGDEEEAKDVVQDCMLRLWQTREEVHNMKGFARILVRNRSLDITRRRKTSIQIESLESADIATPDEHDERIERMMTLVNALPTMQQTVLRLRHMEGKEMSEIAEMIGTTEQAIRQSLSRARRAVLASYTKQTPKQ